MRFCRTSWPGPLVILLVASWIAPGFGADDPPLAEYFRSEVAKIEAKPLAGANSAETWKAARPELRRQIREMLGLDPMPDRGDLHVQITGTIERPDFVIERLHYQSSPGLYVTGNLYRPKKVEGRLPAILYVCGHAKVEKDGVILGCKAHYQHHPAWFAANGYVCLIVDTLQLGEVPGLHHGTAREAMWWWESRGYTPAGIEAWNALRGVDYLISRPEVDPTRIGVTGRSGGGATSWWVGALDDRIAAVAPVAGITDLQDHVVAGVVEGHCDCMYYCNTYRWDFPTLAALIAPVPMLVVNTDRDPIFPEGGVRRVYAQAEKVYGWYGAADRLGLVIGEGPHADTEEIRHPTFAFFEKWLKHKDVGTGSIEEPDRKVPIEDLKVLRPGEVPPYARNGVIHESFVNQSAPPTVPKSPEAWESLKSNWMAELQAKVFNAWPAPGEEVPLDRAEAFRSTIPGRSVLALDFNTQAGIRLRAWCLIPEAEAGRSKPSTLVVLDQASWEKGLGKFLVETETGQALATEPGNNPWSKLLTEAEGPVIFVAPRGIGPTSWPASKDVQIRRRFALLGQTLDGMRVWDVRRAIAVLRDTPELAGSTLEITAAGPSTSLALWASVFEPEVSSISLIDPPTTWRDGPSYFGVERVLGLPQAASLVYPRPLTLIGTSSTPWSWTVALSRNLAPAREWPHFVPAP
ncbi:alpha/beta hydrolase family protein [Tundrisphaera lichenicola]|uniref:alpha/beta hydrolase family protein n=1 Tax=Tundrisphaera lichenicola TaxID=2029860 RepID=UPI003EC06822